MNSLWIDRKHTEKIHSNFRLPMIRSFSWYQQHSKQTMSYKRIWCIRELNRFGYESVLEAMTFLQIGLWNLYYLPN